MKIDLHIKWKVVFNRADNKIEISMFEQFDGNPYLVAIADEKKVKIWPWDTLETLREKVVSKQQSMYSRYLATKDFNENVFGLCQAISQGSLFVGKHNVSEDWEPKGPKPPTPPKPKKKLPVLEKLNKDGPEILSMQDYKNNKKD